MTLIRFVGDGVSFGRTLGYPPKLACSRGDSTDTFLYRKQEGSQRKAASLLDESPAISPELGMQPDGAGTVQAGYFEGLLAQPAT